MAPAYSSTVVVAPPVFSPFGFGGFGYGFGYGMPIPFFGGFLQVRSRVRVRVCPVAVLCGLRVHACKRACVDHSRAHARAVQSKQRLTCRHARAVYHIRLLPRLSAGTACCRHTRLRVSTPCLPPPTPDTTPLRSSCS
jgi:hypothetical protein